MILGDVSRLGHKFLGFLKSHYLSIQLFFTTLGLAIVWLFQYININGNPSVISRMFYPGVVDRPWMPDNSIPNSIFGFHYFGDWVIRFSYLNLENPYDRNLILPEVFPPFGLLFFKVLQQMGVGLSFWIFTLTSIITWQIVIRMYLPKSSSLEQMLFAFLFVFTSLPFLFNFDRGSVFSLIYGLLGLILYLEKTNQKRKLKIALLVLIISLKPYLVLMSLWWLRKRNYKAFSEILVFTLVSNLFSIFVLRMPLHAILDYLRAGRTFNSGMLKFDFLDQLNGIAWLGRIYAQFNTHAEVGIFVKEVVQLNNLVNLTILFFILKIVLDKATSDKIAICYLVASTPMLITSMQYTMCAMSLIALFLASKIFEVEANTQFRVKVPDSNPHVVSEILFWILVMIMLAPFFINLQDLTGGYSEILDAGPGAQRASHLLNTYFYAPLFVIISFSIIMENRRKVSAQKVSKAKSARNIPHPRETDDL
jgi:hypothetical protein